MCDRLQISEDELTRKIWTCFEYSLMQHTDLMRDRHLDQLLMCAVYVICKVCILIYYNYCFYVLYVLSTFYCTMLCVTSCFCTFRIFASSFKYWIQSTIYSALMFNLVLVEKKIWHPNKMSFQANLCCWWVILRNFAI